MASPTELLNLALALSANKRAANPVASFIDAGAAGLGQGLASAFQDQRALRILQEKDRIADDSRREAFDRQVQLELAKRGGLVRASDSQLAVNKSAPAKAEAIIRGSKQRNDVQTQKPQTQVEILSNTVRAGEEEKRLAAEKEAEQERSKLLFDRADKLSDDLRGAKSFKDFNEIRRSAAFVEEAANRALSLSRGGAKPESLGPADQALITSFNKLLDPGSVVRESEFARTPEGEAFINRIVGRVQALTAGGVGLTDVGRKEIRDLSQILVRRAQEFALQDAAPILQRADEFGVEHRLIVGEGFLQVPEVKVQPNISKEQAIQELIRRGAIPQGSR